MAEVEKNPLFRSKKYVIVDQENRQDEPASASVPDVDQEDRKVISASASVPVVLKHPDNVIVVASPTGRAPPPAAGERRAGQLSTAIKMACVFSKLGRPGCSIVVHEGMYIDPMAGIRDNDMSALGWRHGFSLEIVGTKEVRIVNTSPTDSLAFFCMRHGELTLKNVTMFWRPMNTPIDDFPVERMPTIRGYAAKMALVDVRIHGSKYMWLSCGEDSELQVTDCVFSKCWFLCENKAEFLNCRWFDSIDDDVSAKCRPGVAIYGGSKVTLHQCQFIMRNEFDGQLPRSSGRSAAIWVRSGGKIVMTETSVFGFEYAIKVEDALSSVVVKSCKLLDCFLSAIVSSGNTTVIVQDCELVPHVMIFGINENGKVKFRRNSIRNRESAAEETAFILTDREPKVLDHDFASVRIEIDNRMDHWYKPLFGATRKSRVKHAEQCNDPTWRQCYYCLKTSTIKPEAKFRYCSKCRLICYCSKECQQTHWRDHKLVCVIG